MGYCYVKRIGLAFDEALMKTTEELRREGFGVLTKIDVREKFKEKLDIDFPKYQILGACNPEMAHRAISAEWGIGLLLPCNVIVYEKEGAVFVSIIKPTETMAGIRNYELERVATEVEKKLRNVFERI